MSRHSLRVQLTLFGISCAVLIACSSVLSAKPIGGRAVKDARPNREFKLKVGQRVTLKGTRLQIKFISVANDSRCPSDVTCVWAGNAAARFQLSTGRSQKMVTLNTSGNATFVREVEYKGYKVKLVDLSPYPRSDRKIAPHDYVATLLVSNP